MDSCALVTMISMNSCIKTNYFYNYSQSIITYDDEKKSLWLCLKALTCTACMQNANGLVLYLLTW